MSAIAGIVRFDAAPAGATLLARMLDSLAHRGRDGRGARVAGPVALGHLAFHTTPEAAAEAQPLHDPDADLTIVFDGRLDNGEELRSLLAARGAAPRTRADAELALRAYAAWNDDCASRLLGDFAFAVWDGRRRRLFCARDILGVRPFCYRWTPRLLQFASEPQALLRDPDFSPRSNEGMAAEYLAGIVTSREETLVDGIRRLPPAHLLIVDERGVRRARYWQPDPEHRIRYRTPGEYEEHLRSMFREAVRCRLRTSVPIGVMLSGGLDSSSIVGMAETLRRTAGAPAIRTFSMTFPDRPCDEGPYARAVTDMWGVAADTLGDTAIDWVASAEHEVQRYADVPALPSNTSADPIRALARARGVRVLLFGVGGDEWFRGSPSYYADLLRRGQVLTLIRQARLDAGDSDFVGAVRAARLAAWPLVPRALQRIVKRAIGHDLLPAWLDRRFVERTDLRARLERFRTDVRFENLAKADSFTEATSGQATLAIEHLDRSLAWLGIEARHPFHDRRLIEFALALPSREHWWDGYSKSLLRRAMRDLLPAMVRQRRWAPDYSHLMTGALDAHWRAGSFEPRVTAEFGWLRPREFRESARRLVPALTAGDRRAWPAIWPLWAGAAIELWARAAMSPAAAVRLDSCEAM